MDKLNLKLNDVDIAGLVTPTGLQVNYKKVLGSNSGYMLDGGYTEDLIAIKREVSITFMPLASIDLSAVLNNLHNSKICKLYYYDPQDGDYREANFMPQDLQTVYRGKNVSGQGYWTGLRATFEEL